MIHEVIQDLARIQEIEKLFSKKTPPIIICQGQEANSEKIYFLNINQIIILIKASKQIIQHLRKIMLLTLSEPNKRFIKWPSLLRNRKSKIRI
jgi:serine kinase of HPr protein (carbohydrate metabolism regulator)